MNRYNGILPKRKSGDLKYWAGVVPGDTSETMWTRYHTYDELPKVVDPLTGYVQNTNDPQWNAASPASLDPEKYPAYTAGRSISFRNERSIRLMSEASGLTLDKFIALKHENYSELADRVLPDLLAAVEAHGSAKGDGRSRDGDRNWGARHAVGSGDGIQEREFGAAIQRRVRKPGNLPRDHGGSDEGQEALPDPRGDVRRLRRVHKAGREGEGGDELRKLVTTEVAAQRRSAWVPYEKGTATSLARPEVDRVEPGLAREVLIGRVSPDAAYARRDDSS
jgi:hypothetical protein